MFSAPSRSKSENGLEEPNNSINVGAAKSSPETDIVKFTIGSEDCTSTPLSTSEVLKTTLDVADGQPESREIDLEGRQEQIAELAVNNPSTLLVTRSLNKGRSQSEGQVSLFTSSDEGRRGGARFTTTPSSENSGLLPAGVSLQGMKEK